MEDNKNIRTHYRQLYVKVAPGEIYAFIPGTIMKVFVEEGQKVKKGEPMMKLDLEFLSANAPSITSPILDTEPEDNQRIRLLANGEIKAGEPLFAVETLE